MTAALLAKEKVNAFGVMEPVSETGARSSRAYGIYAKAAFCNHDCLPNACRFDYIDVGRSVEMTVRMIHEVPEGREVCLSYFPVNERFARRQKVLREDYGFVCECDRCKVEASWSDNEPEVEDDEAGEGMEEDEDEDMGGDDESGSDVEVEGIDEKGDDFPHAYFFVRFMCGRTNCGGTLAPLPPGEDGRVSDVMECNVCGSVKKDEEIGGSGQNGISLDGKANGLSSIQLRCHRPKAPHVPSDLVNDALAKLLAYLYCLQRHNHIGEVPAWPSPTESSQLLLGGKCCFTRRKSREGMSG